LIKKILNFFLLSLLAILLTSSFFTTEAKFLDIKTSDSVYVSLDLRDPSRIGLEIYFINKIVLRGEYSTEDKSLKVKTSINDFDLTQLGKHLKFPVSGYIKKGNINIEKGEIKLNCTSEELKIKDFKVKNIKVELLKEGNKLTISSLKAKVSGGEINLTGALNLSNNKGNLNLTANSIDIAQAMHELNVGGKKPHGKLSIEANLRNVDLFKWKDLLGEGKILISEGDIYQINFLKGLGKFLSIPDFENIVFKRAYSDLFFEGEDIFFENFQLNATRMNIEGKGKITTAGNIDFLLFPQFSQELIDSSEGLQKYLTALLGGDNLSIEIKGTLKNPRYGIKISLIPTLDKIEDIIDIFKDLFD